MNLELEILKSLADQIREEGPIPTARISSAQSRGTSKKYPYWGVARWEIRVGSRGLPVCRPQSRAKSERRSIRLVRKDLEKICSCEGRKEIYDIGTLRWDSALVLLKEKKKILDLALRVAVLNPEDVVAKKILDFQ